MNPLIRLANEVNLLYNRWQTSTDEKLIYKSFLLFSEKLKELTNHILFQTTSHFNSESDDIYAELLSKVYYEQLESKINTVDFFSAWYRKVLKNHIRNLVKGQKRKKRQIIQYESSLGNSIEEVEEKFCMKQYVWEEALSNAKELIHLIFNDENDTTITGDDKRLFFERHVFGISIKELAAENNTTINGIKSRLKRIKKRMKQKYMTLDSLNLPTHLFNNSYN